MSYGLGGAGLAGIGLGHKQQAMDAAGQAARSETERDIANKQANTARKAGNAQLGSTLGALGGMALGAQYGAIGGPLGSLIGGVVGALGASLF